MTTLDTEYEFFAQPPRVGVYLSHMAAGWGRYGDEYVLKLCVFFSSTRTGWTTSSDVEIEKMLALPPETRARAGGRRLDVMLRSDAPVRFREQGEPLPDYLESLREAFVDVSRLLAPMLHAKSAKLKPPHAHWKRLASAIDSFVVEHGQRADFGVWLASMEQQQRAAYAARKRAADRPTELSEGDFWQLVSSFERSHRVAREKLSRLGDGELGQFVARLTHTLWELDRPIVARAVYGSTDVPSGDDFTDARCAIVTRGSDAYTRALEGSVAEPDERAEWLGYLGEREYERRTGRAPEWSIRYTIESGANPAWGLRA